MLLTLIIVLGGVGAMLLMLNAARGPSASKTLKRRIEMVKERHGDIIAANAQAQIRKLFANRTSSHMEGLASTIIPKPALLRKRLEMTGREIPLSKYLMVSIGIAVVVLFLLMIKGAPFLLGLFAGLFVGIGLPHFIVGKMIKRRSSIRTSRMRSS
jgi:tight adherence protein B